MRFTLVLDFISKEAGKADMPTVEEKTRKAHELMHKINDCIQTKWSAYSCNQADETHSKHSASAVLRNIPKTHPALPGGCLDERNRDWNSCN